jgi:hypothetical protein
MLTMARFNASFPLYPADSSVRISFRLSARGVRPSCRAACAASGISVADGQYSPMLRRTGGCIERMSHESPMSSPFTTARHDFAVV